MKAFPDIIGSPQFHRASPGVGTKKGAGYRKISIAFSDGDFEAIRKLAARQRQSFAEQVRTLVEWGLEAK